MIGVYYFYVEDKVVVIVEVFFQIVFLQSGKYVDIIIKGNFSFFLIIV